LAACDQDIYCWKRFRNSSEGDGDDDAAIARNAIIKKVISEDQIVCLSRDEVGVGDLWEKGKHFHRFPSSTYILRTAYLGGKAIRQRAFVDGMFTKPDCLLEGSARRWNFDEVVQLGGYISEGLYCAGEIDVDRDGLFHLLYVSNISRLQRYGILTSPMWSPVVGVMTVTSPKRPAWAQLGATTRAETKLAREKRAAVMKHFIANKKIPVWSVQVCGLILIGLFCPRFKVFFPYLKRTLIIWIRFFIPTSPEGRKMFKY